MSKQLKTRREKILYNCRKATLLIERKHEVELAPRERTELELHLAGCYICRVYEQQSILMNGLMSKIFKAARLEPRLDDAFKDEIKKRIKGRIIRGI